MLVGKEGVMGCGGVFYSDNNKKTGCTLDCKKREDGSQKKKEKKESSRWKVRGCNVRRWRFRMKQKLQRNLRRALDHRVL